jgi:NAD(P)-dependent dehydrogenase (short-subunit alcohol dehydrogenase family)
MQSDDKLVTSVDGVEMVYQVNHLSHFLLTRLMLPSLSRIANRPSRIVHTSSSMHYLGSLPHDSYSSSSRNTDSKTARLAINSYCDTKLMNVIFSNALDSRFRSLGVTSNPYAGVTSVSIHPGFVMSELDRGIPAMQSVVKKVRELIARPTIDGAITQVTLATLPSLLSEGGGLYYEDHCMPSGCRSCLLCTLNPRGGVQPHSSATSTEEQDWLWNTSSEIVGLAQML